MASALFKTEHYCQSGRHVMDPGWTKCPYCEGENKSKIQTVYQEPVFSSASDDRKTRIGGTHSIDGGRGETKVMPSNQNPNIGGYGGRGDTRRIRGVIITYSWHPQGDLFPVREGKNYIGAGTVNREPGDPYCDILVKEDSMLSSSHALILCQQGNFMVEDLASSNGTFIEDKIIISRTELPDIATIKTGKTVWTFMKVLAGDSLPNTMNNPEPIKEKPKPTEPEPSPSKDTIVR